MTICHHCLQMTQFTSQYTLVCVVQNQPRRAIQNYPQRDEYFMTLVFHTTHRTEWFLPTKFARKQVAWIGSQKVKIQSFLKNCYATRNGVKIQSETFLVSVCFRNKNITNFFLYSIRIMNVLNALFFCLKLVNHGAKLHLECIINLFSNMCNLLEFNECFCLDRPDVHTLKMVPLLLESHRFFTNIDRKSVESYAC